VAYFSTAAYSGDAIEKAERLSTPKRACLFGRRKSARSASFVAMMQTTDLRERDILPVAGRSNCKPSGSSGGDPHVR